MMKPSPDDDDPDEQNEDPSMEDIEQGLNDLEQATDEDEFNQLKGKLIDDLQSLTFEQATSGMS